MAIPSPDDKYLKFDHVPHPMTILGGGASGLCVGYYAKKNGVNFKIHEATDTVGGNAITIKFKDFLFDSGAHRWHDKHPDITRELNAIMGRTFRHIHVPSHIYYNKGFIDFPLSPFNLLKNLGPAAFAKAVLEVFMNRVFNPGLKDNFNDFAINTYGRSLAGAFLINYSEKLWGLPCQELSPHSAGKRLNGLSLKTFIKEGIFGSKAKTEHLDGSFYYPKYGIGDILNKWVEGCGRENIITRSKITKIFHDSKEIHSVEVNGREKMDADYIVNTLPVSLFLNMLTPPPPEEILKISKTLRYRHLKLVAIFLDRDSVTKSATVYFPDKDFIFTRVYEPKNRSIHMSPKGLTSLIAEIPCHYESECWGMEDRELIEITSSKLIETGLIREREIMDARVYSMDYAYPVFEAGFEDKMDRIFNYLRRFGNLAFSGRNAKFEYLHLHDTMKSGKEIVENYKAGIMG